MDTDEPKEEVNVKVEVPDLCLDENKRRVYEEIVQLVEEAKVSSSKAFSTAQESSFMLFPGHQEEKDPGKLYQNFSSPLMTAVESLDMTLVVLKSMEADIYVSQTSVLVESLVNSIPGDLKEEWNHNDDDIDNINDNYNNNVEDEDEDEDFVEDDYDIDEDYKEMKPKKRKQSGTKKKGAYKCDQCDYSSNISRYLSYHKQTHGPGKYQCELCQYNRNKPYEMKLHMKRSHEIESVEYLVDREDPEVKYFLCQICSYLNPCKDVLQEHYQEKHTNNKNDVDLEGSDDVKREDDVEQEEQDLVDSCQDRVTVKSETGGEQPDRKRKRVEENGNIKEEDEEKETELSSNAAPYSCDKCPYTTANLKYYEDHIQGTYAYKKCPFCSKEFQSLRGRLFSNHIKRMHKQYITKDGNFRCNDCNKEFKKIVKFEIHLSKEHNLGIKYHCAHCDYSTEKRTLYNLHVVTHGNAELPCPHCSFLAKSAHRLEKHIYVVHTCRKCKICDLTFEVPSQLFQHNRDVHRQMEICDVCGYECATKENLQRHKLLKHEERTVSCDQCGFMTATQTLLNLHVKVKHLKYYEKDLFCDQCDYSTRNRSNLKHHVNSKHLKMRFSCDLCDTTCASQVSLRKHRKTKHSSVTDKKIQCEEENCEYTTFCKDNLKCHVEKVHQGIRWPCDQCEYVGGYKGDLTRHIKVVHHGFILRCQLCDYSTPKKYYLKGHMLKVHGIANQTIGDTKLF